MRHGLLHRPIRAADVVAVGDALGVPVAYRGFFFVFAPLLVFASVLV